MEGTQQPSFVVRPIARLYESVSLILAMVLMAPISAMGTATARRIFLAIAVINIAFPLDIHLGYREDVGEIGSLGGWNISLTTLALLGLYGPLLFRSAIRGYAAPPNRIHWGVPLCLYILFSLVSLLNAQDVTLGLIEIFLLGQLFLLYLYVANSVSSRKDVNLILGCLLIGLAGQAAVMIASYYGGSFNFLGNIARVDENIATDLGRVGGTVGSPNMAAAYLGMAAAVAGGVLLSQIRKTYRFIALLGLLLGTVALVFTFTRGGWIAFAVSALVLMIFALTRDRRSRKTAMVLAATATVIMILLSGPIRTRLTADDRGAAYSRVPLMRVAGFMIVDHPVLGVGANNFATAMGPYFTRGLPGEFIWTVHNKYLLVWTEIGPIGVLAFTWFFVAALRRGMRCWAYREPVYSAIAVGCMAALAGHMVQMLSEPFRARPAIQLAWLLAALLVVLHREIPAWGAGFAENQRRETLRGPA
jgi:O-antigen ligase